jgi:hypothetical protein
VDFVYSGPEMILSAGHTYRVRFNEDSSNPTVVEAVEQEPQDPEAP